RTLRRMPDARTRARRRQCRRDDRRVRRAGDGEVPPRRRRRPRLRSLHRVHRCRGRRGLRHVRRACAQRVAEGIVAEGEPRSAAAALRLGISIEARAACAAGDRQRRHRDGKRSDHAPRPRGRRDARPCGVPRSLSVASPRCRVVRRRAAHARRVAARAAALRGSRSGARRVPQAHHAAPARPVLRRARWPCIPPGAERRRAQARRRLVAGRARARAHRNTGVRRMITRDIDAFSRHVRTLAHDFGPPVARAAFLVAPDGFRLAAQSATDNRYMASHAAFDAARALQEHRALHRALSGVIPTICFPGDPDAPDALFPNNVFATAANGRYIVGRMRHPVRQREAQREDIRAFFAGVLDYAEIDLSLQPHVCELTGALVIDRARGIGWCGLSERCDEEGAHLMHDAFGLRATLLFDLAPGEYHTNVVLAVLAGRAVLACPRGFANAAVIDALAQVYGSHVIVLSDAEHAAFAGNAIALSPDAVWMSARADAALAPATRAALAQAGFAVRSVPLAAIEAAGGSLRCCVGEVF